MKPATRRYVLFAAWLLVPAVAMADDTAKTMDANGDGMISPAEHAAGAKKMFAGMDANGDGNVTAAEMDAYQASRPHKSGKHATMTSAEKIRAIDTNGDGRISAAEHEAGSQKMFARMDTNGDGHLTAAEMKAGHETLMKPDAAAGDGR